MFAVTTIVVFLVREHYARYDHITDGYLGMGNRIVEAFGTYDEAMQYIAENYNEHEVDSDLYATVSMDVTVDREDMSVGREYQMHELHVNSYYTGPATSAWDSIPF